MTATATTRDVVGPGTKVGLRRVPRWGQALFVLGIWVLVWAVMRGQDTLILPGQAKTGLHDSMSQWKSDLIAGRDDNAFMQFTGWIADQIEAVGTWLQELVSEPAPPRPVPEIGWFGVVAVASWVGFAVAGWRIALLVLGSFLAFGLLGYWEDSMDTLIITFFSVAVALVVGLPLAVLMAKSTRVTAVVAPVLDLLQTMPSFNYLLPVFLFFGLGIPAGLVATVIYCTPPVVRIAAHGIRSVSGTTVEATDSVGQTRWQRLRKVELPMAKSTIVVGINQTTLAALAIVIIGGFINMPGLGGPVLDALTGQQTGNAFVSGLCIVIMAIMLDRTTTAASVHGEKLARSRTFDPRRHRIVLAVTGAVALVCVYYSRTYLKLAEFPESALGPAIGREMAMKVQSFADWFTSTFDAWTTAIKDVVSTVLLNPLQDLIANSPWYVTAVALTMLALVVSGLRPALITVVCLTGLYLSDLWNDSMITLTMTLVGALIVMILALVLGVAMARRPGVDLVLRPVLDAAQVMPAFVYLIPTLLLFGPTRFTAIVAGVIYAAPIAIKLVADGIARVSATTVEAAVSSGSTAWQVITKVQLPMARGNVVLAVNQGLLYVLSVVVIGGLVGAGALGYDSVLGFSQSQYFGKGIAAAGCIVLLGIMLDRFARGAVERQQRNNDILTMRPISGAI